MAPIRITVWNEFIHEKSNATAKELYPEGMHEAIAGHLRTCEGLSARTATLDQPEHGLTKEVLAETDVLLWWGHAAHGKVSWDVVDRVQQRVLQGMGLIVLHSGHMSRIFGRLMGTGCKLRWREQAERERLWVVSPTHPITQGIGPYIELPNTEMYGEHFDVPDPDELIFISWFEGGEVFRSGAVWKRGLGKVFYFRPGHETYPIFHNPEVLKIIENGVRYVSFAGNAEVAAFYGKKCVPPIEKLSEKNYHQAPIDHPTA
jgi:trehalose utilization protein